MPFPISMLEIRPLNEKFADRLTHRDYLGTLMGLGIERDLVGDIAVRENRAFVFVIEHMAGYVMEHLDRVRHTSVRCSLCGEVPEAFRPQLAEEELIVSSIRADAVLCRLYHLSRGKAQELVKDGKLLINGRVSLSVSYEPKEGDVIVLRGYGKSIFRGKRADTKKGKEIVVLARYI